MISRRFYLNIWLLLLFVLILSSCAGMRPPGYHNNINKFSEKKSTEKNSKNNKKDKEIEVINSDNFDVSAIQEFENKIINFSDTTEIIAGERNSNNDKNLTAKKSDEKVNKEVFDKLLTLDQQLSKINLNQDNIIKKVDKIENNVSSLEKRIDKIENKIDDKNIQPVKREEKKKKINENNNNFIILPDEKVKKTKTVKVNYTKSEEPKNHSMNKDVKDKFEAGIKFFNASKYSLCIETLENININENDNLYNSVNYYIAKSFFNKNNYNKTIDYLNKILKTSNSSYKPDAMILAAKVYINKGDSDRAKNIYRNFVSDFPSNKHTPTARKMLQKL